jgi:hypothetical protein
MSNLKTAIENLYNAFSEYTTLGIHHCDCGCIDEEDVKKLYSKPLKQLQVDDLSSYHGSALYTWGDLEHYKHFLPRVFELYAAKRKYALIGLYEIGTKLEYAKWGEWFPIEVKAIKDFVLADWIEFANDSNSEIRDSDLENYSRFFEVEELLKMWKITQAEKALKNFVSFFYYYGNQILDKGVKVNDKQYGNELKDLIYADNLVDRLQDEFFRYETTDNEYAEKVSIVLQMVEQQLKLDRINSR